MCWWSRTASYTAARSPKFATSEPSSRSAPASSRATRSCSLHPSTSRMAAKYESARPRRRNHSSGLARDPPGGIGELAVANAIFADRVGAGSASRLQYDLDEKWTGGGDPFGKAVVERLHRRDLRTGHAHRARQPHPVEIGVAEIEDVECFAPRIAGADIGELALEDRVAAVRE